MRSTGRRRIRSAASEAATWTTTTSGIPYGEEEREGERRGEGLLAHLAVDLDREQLADEDERGEDPELGVEGAEVAGAERRQRDEYRDARGADEPEVEGERGL